ncbi:MAG: DUF1292 domain-containing protein [Clostridiales bacterium]|nr:DUF1292 domain-containing protein [Clostridiales bacterium]
MEEKDILVFSDEEGQEIQLEILDYFEYGDEEYAMLAEADADEDHDHEHDHDCESCNCHSDEKNIYLMKVVMEGDEEQFVPVDEDIMDELIDAIEDLYNDDDEDDDDDDDDDDEDEDEDEYE